jgi:hypothetical protein
MEDYHLQFINCITDCLKKWPDVRYDWRNDNSEIVFKKKSENGFDVIIGHHKNHLFLNTDRGYHEHFEAYEDFSGILSHVMESARDLLSKNMRIREISANGNPRKWVLEHFNEGTWKTKTFTGKILWNFFGRKTEKVFSNDILPERR